MNPLPPFPSDLSPEDEIAQFEALKPRLQAVWQALVEGDEEAYTSVVVPSLTLDQSELRKLPGASFYEERLLFLLIRLRNPRARMVFVTSQPVHQFVLEYYFQFLAGIPASHARARLTLLCAYDASPRSLTEKILERPRLLQRIREGIDDRSRAYLTVFNSTPLERRLAVLLDIPLNGVDPNLIHLGTKSGSRKVFLEAGVELPLGFEDLRTEHDVVNALVDLKKARPSLRRAVVKLNESFSGEGNALFRYPQEMSLPAVHDELRALEFAVPAETPVLYFEKLGRMGGIVEEFIEAPEKSSPSTQMRISPTGEVLPISTHDQLLGGPSGQVFLGCVFPADKAYRLRMQEEALKIGRVLAAHGVVSRFGVDFLVWRGEGDADWHMAALEINLRMGGTTHPYLALQFLTGGKLDPSTGLYLSPSGHTKYYRATDNLRSELYRGLLPEDLIEILTVNKLHYSHGTESGVLFHLIGALSQFGKVGLTAIANSPEEVDELYRRTLAVLNREAALGRPPVVDAGTLGPI
jgi:pheganomycin biosynthesis PGM1-like protein